MNRYRFCGLNYRKLGYSNGRSVSALAYGWHRLAAAPVTRLWPILLLMLAPAYVLAAGNAVQSLPRMTAPSRSSVSVTVNTSQGSGMEALLAKTLTPRTIRIEGVKSIPFDMVSKKFAGFVGKPTTVKALLDTASEVTKLYQDRGYALSFAFIPSQDFANGVVRVVAVEGYVASVSITGKPGNEEKQIRAIAQHLVNQRPLRRDMFERYVGLLGRLPGLKVAANVAPPGTTDGATDLKLDVTRRKIALSTGVSFNQPGVQGLFTVSENGLLSLGEQLSVSALAPRGPDGQTYYAVNYTQPLGSNGLTAKIDASRYRGEPESTAGLPSSVKRAVAQDRVGVSLSYPIILTNNRSLSVTGSGYGVSNDDRFTNQDNGASVGLRSQARVLQAEVAWVDAPSINDVRRASFVVAKGINALGASKEGYTNVAGNSVSNPVDLNFVRVGATASETHTLPYGFAAVASATGQYSGQSLPTSEQITFGAQRYALAYEPGEAAGDSGWAASLEMNRAFSFSTAYLKSLVPYLSYAIARTYLSHTNAPGSRLASVAVGVRMSDSRYYSLDLAVAKAVGDAPVESSSRSPRINATFSYQLD